MMEAFHHPRLEENFDSPNGALGLHKATGTAASREKRLCSTKELLTGPRSSVHPV